MRPATRQLRKILVPLLALAAWLPVGAGAQGAAPAPGRPLAEVIDEYVREGLKSNLSLHSQTLEVERSAAALDEARARYFPELAFAARYSRSEGGRTIELPLGDALNPAYQTLNDLLVQQGQQPQFPVVQNETVAFLRERETDVNTLVYDALAAHGGSISAEHGIGALKRDELARRKSPVALKMMRAIKLALDPQNLMNPGRML
jgi:FAD/FMN-containing dehydrogenase